MQVGKLTKDEERILTLIFVHGYENLAAAKEVWPNRTNYGAVSVKVSKLCKSDRAHDYIKECQAEARASWGKLLNRTRSTINLILSDKDHRHYPTVLAQVVKMAGYNEETKRMDETTAPTNININFTVENPSDGHTTQ